MPKYAVFSRRRRSSVRLKNAAEGQFAYLDASARPKAVKVRRLVEQWFSELPKSARFDWLQRFRSPNDAEHRAAFFELLLHHWLLHLGFKVELHPHVPGTSKRPDFLATHPDGREFYLEGTSTDGFSADELRVERFVDQVLGEIAKITSSAFFLDIKIRRKPTQQPALAKLRQHVEHWLGTVDYAKVKQDPEKHSIRISPGGGDVLITPWPKHKRRIRPVLGAMMRNGLVKVDSQETILPALRKKASRYGKPDRPYVIAVNDLSEWFDEHHAMESAFGRERWVVASDGRQWPEWDGSGLFGRAGSPRATRVSAILVIPGVTPWNFARQVPELVCNPWATRSLGNVFDPCHAYFMRGGKLVEADEAPSLGEILGLPGEWPE